MTTRLRAGPRSMAAVFAFTAIIAASAALLAATPVQAAATTTLKFQQYNEAPATITMQAATAATTDYGLVSEVTSPPTVAWASSNQAFANYTAASVSPRAAPVNMATVTNSTVDAKKNLVLGAARAAPLATANNVSFTYSAATNAASMGDFKTTALSQINDEKKITAIGARAAPAIKMIVSGCANPSSTNPATTAGS